jgi:phosphatidylglycerophosphate synthase
MRIFEMREKCQRSREKVDTWYGINIARRISIYVTWLFVSCGMNAMSATTLFVASGFLASGLLMSGREPFFLMGAVALHIWYILDHVDGEVARWNNETSYTGMYYDLLCHYIIHPIAFFSVGIGLFVATSNFAFVLAGSIAAFGSVMMGAVDDLKDLVVLGAGPLPGAAAGTVDMADIPDKGLYFRMFSFTHKTVTFPVFINVFLLAAVLDIAAKTLFFKAAVILYYAVSLNLVWASRASVFVVMRKADREISGPGHASDNKV